MLCLSTWLCLLIARMLRPLFRILQRRRPHNVEQREQSNSFANSYDVFYRPPIANSKEEYQLYLQILNIQKDIASTPLEDDGFTVVTSKKSKKRTEVTMSNIQTRLHTKFAGQNFHVYFSNC
ncbi:unnamed protein product [Cuscuta europaea]|uniref:Uncharacterized protein n=1 Tax=Cuscuta europaea TaxID=41803 RepID=A0A9P1EM08_CUSEU|nr:unnamed protein product [Cuscuta europaea]